MEAVYRGATEVNSAMLRVYNNMCLAVITSMVVSYLVSTSPTLMQFFFTGVMKWIVIFAPLIMIFAMTWAMTKATKFQAQAMLQLFAALMGLSSVHRYQHCWCVFWCGCVVCYHECLRIFYQDQFGQHGQVYDCGSNRHHHCQHC